MAIQAEILATNQERYPWAEIRGRWEAGEGATALARVYGATIQTIRAKAAAQDWFCPPKPCKMVAAEAIGDAAEAIGDAGGVQPEAGESAIATQLQQADAGADSLPATQSQLAAPVLPPDASPEAVQSALAAWGEQLLLAGMALIEPPRNLSEAKTLNDIIRKARGMDLKGASITLSLVAPPRALARRPGRIVDLETVAAELVTSEATVIN